ncbi:MAG: hypothetical protein JKY56_01825 [Kofleriaceae bacterium]|nr:hypothetical protein [Kofleriaceae bacterium]
MYQCQQCQQTIAENTPSYRLVIETVSVNHPQRSYWRRRTSKGIRDSGGSGSQIVRELRVCRACYRRGNKWVGELSVPNPEADRRAVSTSRVY